MKKKFVSPPPELKEKIIFQKHEGDTSVQL